MASGLSFGLKKKDNKILKTSVLGDVSHKKEEETDFVYSLEGKEVKSSKPAESKTPKQLVIPLIQQNNWRTPYLEKIADKEEKDKQVDSSNVTKENSESEGDTGNDLTALAAKEILENTALQNQNWEERGKPDTSLSVPLLVRNKVPEGFEAEDGKLDVALRPDEPEDANYEEIPIDQFGFAMLRGMGWKDGEGIGKNKQVIAPLDAPLRPKGLGLGADRSAALQKKNGNISSSLVNGEEESLVLKKGAFCLITKGKDKDLYGIVEGIDEDNARVMVKLTLSGKTVTVSQYAIEIVNKRDYDKFSKYLNKAKVDKYKEEAEEKERKRSRDRSRSPKENHKRKSHRDRSRSPKERKKHHRRSESPDEKHDRKRKHKNDTSNRQEKKVKQDRDNTKRNNFLWVRPDIRVRIVDKKFKSGKYYKSKVVVIDVVSEENCVCKTEEGKVLEGLSQSVLETVIPKTDHAHALIVSGSHQGQIGEVIKRSKEKCEALLQLLSDRDTVLKLSYDDICEYVGDIDHEFDY